MRVLGDRKGIAVAAIAGSLASSTATTLSFARLAREHPQGTRLLASGILLAGVTMMARIVVLAGVLKPELVAALIWPVVAAAAVLLAGAAVLCCGEGRAAQPNTHSCRSRIPSTSAPSCSWPALIAVILLLAKLVAAQAGNAGLFLLAAISGIADVDALTLSMARLSGVQVSAADAATAILVAASVNTASKATIAGFVGGTRLGSIVGVVSVMAIGALGITFVMLR